MLPCLNLSAITLMMGMMTFLLSRPAATKSATTASPLQHAAKARMARCIVECAQCQDLLGARFDHRLCSKECLERKGLNTPDCTNPAAIRRYLIEGGATDALAANLPGAAVTSARRLLLQSATHRHASPTHTKSG